MKSAGFNALRKHIKISGRWYYHCDRLGMCWFGRIVFRGSAYGHLAYEPEADVVQLCWGRLMATQLQNIIRLYPQVTGHIAKSGQKPVGE